MTDPVLPASLPTHASFVSRIRKRRDPYAEALKQASAMGIGIAQFDSAIKLYDNALTRRQKLWYQLTPAKLKKVPDDLVEALKLFLIVQHQEKQSGQPASININAWIRPLVSMLPKEAVQQARKQAADHIAQKS